MNNLVMHDVIDQGGKLGEQLVKLMQRKNIDVKMLALETGISVPAINKLRRGVGNPTLGTLLALAQYFNVTIDELVSLKNMPDNGNMTLTLPVYHLLNAEARNPSDSLGKISIDLKPNQSRDLFAVEIHNNIMAPFYEKGTVFIVDPDLHYSDGDLVLITFRGQPPCFRQVFVQQSRVLFKGIDLDSKPMEAKQFVILGVVVKSIQSWY